jgi:hypothetical protein
MRESRKCQQTTANAVCPRASLDRSSFSRVLAFRAVLQRDTKRASPLLLSESRGEQTGNQRYISFARQLLGLVLVEYVYSSLVWTPVRCCQLLPEWGIIGVSKGPLRVPKRHWKI